MKQIKKAQVEYKKDWWKMIRTYYRFLVQNKHFKQIDNQWEICEIDMNKYILIIIVNYNDSI